MRRLFHLNDCTGSEEKRGLVWGDLLGIHSYRGVIIKDPYQTAIIPKCKSFFFFFFGAQVFFSFLQLFHMLTLLGTVNCKLLLGMTLLSWWWIWTSKGGIWTCGIDSCPKLTKEYVFGWAKWRKWFAWGTSVFFPRMPSLQRFSWGFPTKNGSSSWWSLWHAGRLSNPLRFR